MATSPSSTAQAAFALAGGVAVVGAALALAFLPQRAAAVQRRTLAVVTKLRRGLADEARLATLLELREGLRAAAQVAASMGLSSTQASDRLQCLTDCCIAEVVAGGAETVYRLADPSVRRLLDASTHALEHVAPLDDACPYYQSSTAISRLAGQA